LLDADPPDGYSQWNGRLLPDQLDAFAARAQASTQRASNVCITSCEDHALPMWLAHDYSERYTFAHVLVSQEQI
jgi:hypothetical protein